MISLLLKESSKACLASGRVVSPFKTTELEFNCVEISKIATLESGTKPFFTFVINVFTVLECLELLHPENKTRGKKRMKREYLNVCIADSYN
jgi:hypothetical protein